MSPLDLVEAGCRLADTDTHSAHHPERSEEPSQHKDQGPVFTEPIKTSFQAKSRFHKHTSVFSKRKGQQHTSGWFLSRLGCLGISFFKSKILRPNRKEKHVCKFWNSVSWKSVEFTQEEEPSEFCPIDFVYFLDDRFDHKLRTKDCYQWWKEKYPKCTEPVCTMKNVRQMINTWLYFPLLLFLWNFLSVRGILSIS